MNDDYLTYIYIYIYIYIYTLIKTEMTHRVLNKHKAKSIIQIYSDIMKTIQCGHPPHP